AFRRAGSVAHADFIFPVFGHHPEECGDGPIPAPTRFLATLHAPARLQRQYVSPNLRTAGADFADEQERRPGLFAGLVRLAVRAQSTSWRYQPVAIMEFVSPADDAGLQKML